MKPPVIGKHLATFNLFREADNSLHVTIADASGVRDELGNSGAPLHLCAMNALKASVELRRPPSLKFDNDAAYAVGEDAFRAGYKAAADRARAFHPTRIEEDAAHICEAWSNYEPPEHIKELTR